MQKASEGTFQGRKQRALEKGRECQEVAVGETGWSRKNATGKNNRWRAFKATLTGSYLFSEPWGLLTWTPDLNFRKHVVWGFD